MLGTLDRLSHLTQQTLVMLNSRTSHAHSSRASHPPLPDKVLHFTWSSKGNPIPLDGLGLTTVTDPKEADFILAHGTQAVNGNGSGDAADEQRKEGAVDVPLDNMKEMLEEAAALGLPMVVANPDIVTVSGGGEESLIPMPGTLKNMYEEMEGGGPIFVMGKPAPIIYHKILEMTGALLEECVAVGDSMEHDIAGAMGAGCASVFVCAGIHAKQLGMPDLSGPEVGDGSGVKPPDEELVAALAVEEGAYPDYAVPVFMW